MKRKREKEFSPLNLIFGLLLGFFLGSTLVYWHLNRQSDRNIHEALEKIMAVFSENNNREVKPSETVNILNEFLSDDLKTEAPYSVDSDLQNQGPAPGLSSTSYSMVRDKLLHRKFISVPIEKTKQSNATLILDSLLGKREKAADEHIFQVEFWESPLNSVGYLMGKSRIILYGISFYELAEIYNEKGNFYLRYMNNTYPMSFTNTFKPLVPIGPTFSMEEVQ
ncbi:MAG: hypothetical protein EA393_11105 [Bacteroidetes bacterium]|nr:MAG: hypothetical protein EA393_11105 [Bacteroidota bacterium]